MLLREWLPYGQPHLYYTETLSSLNPPHTLVYLSIINQTQYHSILKLDLFCLMIWTFAESQQ